MRRWQTRMNGMSDSESAAASMVASQPPRLQHHQSYQATGATWVTPIDIQPPLRGLRGSQRGTRWKWSACLRSRSPDDGGYCDQHGLDVFLAWSMRDGGWQGCWRKLWHHLLQAVMTLIADIYCCGRQERSGFFSGDKTDPAREHGCKLKNPRTDSPQKLTGFMSHSWWI